MYPVTCSLLWVRCLFDRLAISNFGGKWPLKWTFRKWLSGFIDGTPNYVSWQNFVKIGCCEVAKKSAGLPHKNSAPRDVITQKNSGSAGLVPAPILPKMGRSRPKFLKRCHLLTCPRIPNLVRIGSVLPDLFRKDWFFGPQKSIQYRTRNSAYNNHIPKLRNHVDLWF